MVPKRCIKLTTGKSSIHPFLLQDKGLPCWFCQQICVLLEWGFGKASLLPEFWCQESICFHQAIKSGL